MGAPPAVTFANVVCFDFCLQGTFTRESLLKHQSLSDLSIHEKSLTSLDMFFQTKTRQPEGQAVLSTQELHVTSVLGSSTGSRSVS